MDDLLLFRLLRERRYDAAELGELLATVAGLTPAARAPFLGLLAPLLEEPARPHRAAALRCLAGCEGSEAVQLAQGLLDDEDDEVREAALVFFQTLAIRAPMRWVHVVFHGDLRVRRGALREGAPTGASSMAFALLADEGCRDEVRARFLPGAPAR